jgi:DNA-binding NarL/FixJ family response regulator
VDQLTIRTDGKGRIFSHVRQRWLVETPEERVRQNYLCTLVNEYGYRLEQMKEEESATGRGSAQARADFVIWQAEDGDGAVALAAEERPDVVLLDVEMPGPGAEETTRRILRASPRSRVVVLTMHDEASLVRGLLGSGAHAYMIKSATRQELLAAVDALDRSDGDRAVLSVSRETLARLEGREKRLLFARELEVLSLAAVAMSNGQIASRLFISEGTVKRHLTNVYAKLGVASRVEAVNEAVAAGLVASRNLSRRE